MRGYREKIETGIAALAVVLGLPILILNWTSMVVGGVWLAIIGDWSAIVWGLLCIFLGHLLLAAALVPPLLSAYLTVKNLGNHKFIMAISLLKVGLYNYVLVSIWCVGMFMVFANPAHSNVWPYLLWAFSAATTPWQQLAKKELELDPKSSALMPLAGAQFGSLTIIVSVLLGGDHTAAGLFESFIPGALSGMLLAGVMYTIQHN